MDNVILIKTAWGDRDIAIQIERTAQMIAAAHKLSDYIKDLPLTAEQNDTLVSSMIEQVQEAERGAFVQGFKLGMEYQKTAPSE